MLKMESFIQIPGIFPNTFVQPVNGSKKSVLNLVMKHNLFMCFCLFTCLFSKNSWKIFHFIHLFFLPFGLYKSAFGLEKCIKENCMYLVNSSSKFLIKLQNSKKNARKMHFTAICWPKFQKFSLWCPLWGHFMEPLN